MWLFENALLQFEEVYRLTDMELDLDWPSTPPFEHEQFLVRISVAGGSQEEVLGAWRQSWIEEPPDELADARSKGLGSTISIFLPVGEHLGLGCGVPTPGQSGLRILPWWDVRCAQHSSVRGSDRQQYCSLNCYADRLWPVCLRFLCSSLWALVVGCNPRALSQFQLQLRGVCRQSLYLCLRWWFRSRLT